jgi:WD40 repeat protein
MGASGEADTVDLRIAVWNTTAGDGTTRRLRRKLFQPYYDLEHLALSRDAQTMVTVCREHKILVWEVARGTITRSVDCREMGIRVVAVSPDGRWLISNPFDGVLRVWNLETMLIVHDSLEGHDSPIQRAVIVVSEDAGYVHVFELQDGNPG